MIALIISLVSPTTSADPPHGTGSDLVCMYVCVYVCVCVCVCVGLCVFMSTDREPAGLKLVQGQSEVTVLRMRANGGKCEGSVEDGRHDILRLGAV